MKQQNFLCGSASPRRSAIDDAVSRVLAQTQLFKDSFTGLVKVTNREQGECDGIQKAK